MREIKFRAWDAENKEMAPVVEMLFNQYGGIDTRTSRRMDINEDCLGKNSLMQFTGLKDKNGKMIFEGDILKGKNLENFDEIAEVKWDLCQWFPLAGHRAFDECEIIGNIYENPELLTK